MSSNEIQCYLNFMNSIIWNSQHTRLVFCFFFWNLILYLIWLCCNSRMLQAFLFEINEGSCYLNNGRGIIIKRKYICCIKKLIQKTLHKNVLVCSVAITECHRLLGLNSRNLLCSSRGWKSKIKRPAALVSSGTFPGLQMLLFVLNSNVLFIVLVCSLCLFLSLFFFFKLW